MAKPVSTVSRRPRPRSIRQHEQRTSAKVVGVDDVVFLHHPDGVVQADLDLRRDLAREIRRHRPDILLVANYDLTYGLAAGQRIVNQADHRAVGIAALDAARDAGNRWIFPELGEQGLEPWAGVSHVYVMGSNEPTHAVDVTDTIDVGVESLRAHDAYLTGLGRDFDPDEFLRPDDRRARRRARRPARRRLRPRPATRRLTAVQANCRYTPGA